MNKLTALQKEAFRAIMEASDEQVAEVKAKKRKKYIKYVAEVLLGYTLGFLFAHFVLGF